MFFVSLREVAKLASGMKFSKMCNSERIKKIYLGEEPRKMVDLTQNPRGKSIHKERNFLIRERI